MSLVLAFGLSPLGQVPAYATGGDLQTQEAPQLETQDDASGQFGEVIYTIDGENYSTEDTANNPAAPVYTGKANRTVDFAVFDSGSKTTKLQFDATDAAKSNYTLTLTDPDGTEMNGTSQKPFVVSKAGTYTVKIKGTSADLTKTDATLAKSYEYARTKTFTFEVTPLDITELMFQPDGDYTYSGKDQDISFLLRTVPVGTTDYTFDVSKATDEQKAILKANYLSSDTTETDGKKLTQQQKDGGAFVYDGKLYEPKGYLTAGTDYTTTTEKILNAGSYGADLEAKGSCTGTATANFNVNQVYLLLNDLGGAIDETAPKVNSTAVKVVQGTVDGATVYEGHAGFTNAAVVGNKAVATTSSPVPVAYNKSGDPVELKYTTSSDEVVTLKKDTDYTVTYYNNTVDSTNHDYDTMGTRTSTPPTTMDSKFWAVIDVNVGSTNFNYSEGARIVVLYQIAKAGKIESFADRAVLASGNYRGGATVTATTSGAAFYKGDNDVSTLVGESFAFPADATYGILSTNDKDTARLAKVGTAYYRADGTLIADTDADATTEIANAKTAGGKRVKDLYAPVGAGSYYVTVTGDGKTYNAGEGVTATFDVNTVSAVEGNQAGNLKVTMNDVPFKDGSYVSPEPKVEMYTTNGGGLQEIEAEQEAEGALGGKVVNWTVTYYKGDTKVTKPAEKGEYRAVFEFSGNLEGTQPIEKTFKVETGQITDKVSGIEAVTTTFTGNSRALKDSDVKLLDTDGNAYSKEKQKELLNGTSFELTYETGTVAPDAEGNPVNTGTYVVRATFSGNYEGSVTGYLTVGKLDLTNLTAGKSGTNSVAELQYLQEDGSWDADYSVKKTGSAIEPTVRVVLKDSKKTEKTEKAVEVNSAVYNAAFSDNVNAGQAGVRISAGAGYGSHVTASSAVQSKAFTITDKAFSDIGAYIELTGKKSATYNGSPIEGVTLQLTSASAGTIAYTNVANADYAGGIANVTVTGVTAYLDDNSDYYTEKTGGAKLNGAASITPAPTAPSAGDPRVEVKGLTVTYSGKVVYERNGNYYTYDATKGYQPLTAKSYDALADGTLTALKSGTNYTPFVACTADVTVGSATVFASDGTSATTTKYYLDDTLAAAKKIDGTNITVTGITAGTTGTAVTGKADTYSYSATVVFKSQALYRDGASGTNYYVRNGEEFAEVGTSGAGYGDLASGTATVGSPTNAAASTYGYTLKVLDSTGKPVDTAKFVAGDDPYTTVTVTGLTKADTYTIVAGGSSTGTYGGRVTKEFTIDGLDISDGSKFAVAYVVPTRDATTGVLSYVTKPYGAEWAIDFDAEAAKSADGIVLENAYTSGSLSGHQSFITVTPATGKAASETGIADHALNDSLVEGDDYTVTYDANKEAGTATVTIKGKNNYAGELVKEFTINRAEISLRADKRSAGYQVDFVTTPTFKYDSKNDVYYTDYVNADIEPKFEINYYGLKDSFLAEIDNNTKTMNQRTAADYEVKSMLEDSYSAQFTGNKNVSYEPNRPDVAVGATLKITAAGNYEGYIEGHFRIDPIDLYNNSAVTIDDIADVPYTGSPVVPNITVKLNGAALTQGTDYVVTSDNDGSIGEHVAYVASANKGNTTVSTPIAKTFNIKKADEITYDLTGATVELSASSFTYNGQIQAPKVNKVTLKNGTVLTADQFKATIPADSTNAGPYTVKVEGAQTNVTGSAEATYTIAKANNPLKVAKATRTAKKVSKKKAVVKGLNVKKAGQGTMTYKKVSVKKGKKAAAKKLAKKILVNKTTGKITVKKGLAKGTYKVTISAKAAGNGNYNASAVQKAIVTLKVKK